jgi:FkbM family methyltransferase
MAKQRNVLSNSDYGPIIINKHDNTIGMCISEYGYWGTADIQLIESLIRTVSRPGDPICLLDVGSNIGTHALAFGKFPFPELTVHAFEAQREIYYMLAGTIALNNLSNVYCHHTAVSNVSGVELKMPVVDYASKSNFGSYELEVAKHSDTSDMYIEGKFEKIRTCRIDDLNLSNVRLIKIDVEGMEDKVVEGAAQTIIANRPIVFIETFKTDFDPIKAFLVSHNYNLFMTPSRDAVCIPKEHNVGIQGATQIT